MEKIFISDTHFYHDKYHTKNWEYKFWKKYNQIDKDFILYHLGDFSFKINNKILDDLLQKFYNNKHCKNIVLIRGNHDKEINKFTNRGIIVAEKMIIKHKHKKIILTHKPLLFPMCKNIHGHLHNKNDKHRFAILTRNNILVETEKIYNIEDLIK